MKTIEEAANEHIDYCVSINEYDRSSLSFKSGVEFAQRWIPVEEELPPLIAGTSDDVLCVCEGHDFIVGWYDSISNEWRNTFNEESEQVTHWRPIEYK